MPAPDDARNDDRSDPTRVTAQPALTTASGTSWVVVAALLAAASAFPLSGLLIVDPGPSFPLAVATAVVIACLLIAVVVLRLTALLPPQRPEPHPGRPLPRSDRNPTGPPSRSAHQASSGVAAGRDGSSE